VSAAIPKRRNANVTGGICSFAALTTMKFAAQNAMTTSTPSSATRRSLAVECGRPEDAEPWVDTETPAGVPAGVEPGSSGGGASI